MSKDGTRLATTIMNGEGVRIWDAVTWREVSIPLDARAPMVFSPDSKTLATDTRSGITIWSLDGRRMPIVLQNSTNLFFSSGELDLRPSGAIIFSPDGKYLVATRNMLSDQGIFILGIWDLETGRETALPDDPEHIEHTGAISALAFSPNGQILATASMDYSIRLWDFAKRQRLATLQGHLSEVWALTFSPDGQNLVSGAKDGSVKWWPVKRPEKEDIFPGSWQELLAASKDSRQLAVRDRQGTLVFLTNGVTEREFQSVGSMGRSRFGPPGGGGGGGGGGDFWPSLPVALSADFRTIAHVNPEGRLLVWSTENPATNILDVSERQMSSALTLSPDARWLITSGGFGYGFTCWDLVNRTNKRIEGEMTRALFSPDSRMLAVFQRTNYVQIWNVGTWTLFTNWVSDVGLRDCAAFSPDGKILATGCADDTVSLWDTSSGKEIGICSGHKQGISSVAFSPDGKTLVSSSDDRTVKLWHVETQQELLTLRHLGGTLRTLLFSPDGTMLVGRISTGSAKTGLRYYRAPQFSEIDAKEGLVETTSVP
jgi:WD40 repeat protein